MKPASRSVFTVNGCPPRMNAVALFTKSRIVQGLMGFSSFANGFVDRYCLSEIRTMSNARLRASSSKRNFGCLNTSHPKPGSSSLKRSRESISSPK